MAWPLDRLELLKKYWREGLTATEIADIWSISRSAVLGQVHRMRKADPETFSHRARIPGPKKERQFVVKPTMMSRHVVYGPRRKQQISLPPVPFVPAVVDVTPLNVSLLDLQEGQCRFPTSDDAPHFFCGLPQLGGSSYCAEHHAVCWVKPRILNLTEKERARRSGWARHLNNTTSRTPFSSKVFVEAAE